MPVPNRSIRMMVVNYRYCNPREIKSTCFGSRITLSRWMAKPFIGYISHGLVVAVSSQWLVMKHIFRKPSLYPAGYGTEDPPKGAGCGVCN